jgi:hypothetical protein
MAVLTIVLPMLKMLFLMLHLQMVIIGMAVYYIIHLDKNCRSYIACFFVQLSTVLRTPDRSILCKVLTIVGITSKSSYNVNTSISANLPGIAVSSVCYIGWSIISITCLEFI